MVNKIYLNSRFALRSDTLDNWQSKNPVLEDGEPSVVSNGSETEWLKIGDGLTDWNNLPYKLGPMGPQGVQGNKGEKGDKGDKGSDGLTPEADQTYNPESTNAQSGIAVAEALANLPSGSGDFEQIGDIILTEPVNEVVFSEFETPLKDYKQIFMVSAFGVDVDASGAFKIRSAGGGLYFMWSGLGAISANTNYGFWHSIEQMGVDDYPIYKSTYSSQRLNNMGSDIGNLISQGLDANNVAVKSDYTHHNAIIEEYRFGVPSNVKFIAGSRFILFGRK